MSDFFGPHPDRPDTPEFWQLSEVVLANDADATEIEDGFRKVIEQHIATEAVVYMAEQRVGIFRQRVPELPPELTSIFMSVWLDGFAAGAGYRAKYERATDGD